MQLYQEMLIQVLSKDTIEINFSSQLCLEEILKSTCYKLLERIREVIADDSLEDKECFLRIERIIQQFEENGIYCGNRHDF